MSLFVNKSKATRKEVAQTLEDFIEGSKLSRFSWDGFTLGMSFEDETLEEIRLRCAGLSEEFPSDDGRAYCNEKGLQVIRHYIAQLRTSHSDEAV